MKKNIASIGLAALLMLSLAACGGAGEAAGASEPGSAAPPQPTAAPAAAPVGSEAPSTAEGPGGTGSGFSGPITVISREPGSGTRGAFIELFGVEVKDEAGNKTDKTTQEATIANQTAVVLTQVAANKNAIGYISLGSLNDTVKALKIDGAEATPENIKAGAYQVARPFNIATKGAPQGLAADFIRYILSAEGQEIVADGYIKVDDAAAPYAGTKPAGKIVVAGSSSVTPIMEKLREGYLSINPSATIEVQQSDSTAGMQAALNGTCDIGMASRELKESETAALNGTQIALDGIAVIVNKENPLEDMASDVVNGIYTGSLTDWSQVG